MRDSVSKKIKIIFSGYQRVYYAGENKISNRN